MPIRRAHRHFYPIDWPQLSALIRFVRARGCCEGCGRPHMQGMQHLGDGRWCTGRGRPLRRCLPAPEGMATGLVKIARVVLATAHRNHNTVDNADGNLAALCQRCHMLHDRPEHQRRRITLRARKAIVDLFNGLCGH